MALQPIPSYMQVLRASNGGRYNSDIGQVEEPQHIAPPGGALYVYNGNLLQNIDPNFTQAIRFNNILVDTHSAFNIDTESYQPPAGRYEFSLSVLFDPIDPRTNLQVSLSTGDEDFSSAMKIDQRSGTRYVTTIITVVTDGTKSYKWNISCGDHSTTIVRERAIWTARVV